MDAAGSAPVRYPLAASPIHTILVLTIIGGWAWLGKFMADHMRAAATPHRVRSYAVALLFEWLLFAFVAAGVRRWGAPLLILLGERWHSVREVLRNIGIAAAFWLVSLGLLFILGRLLRIRSSSQDMRFILPHGGAEIALWIALSVTAGICEEAIFRGYLQRQFMAFTGSAPAGILISAAAFGVAHVYQGYRVGILVGLYGTMFGILAHWRGSVRPGMMAHAWQDSVSGIMAGAIRH